MEEQEFSFSEAVNRVVACILPHLVNDFSDSDNLISLLASFNEEIWQYCKTGNCGRGNSSVASVNPTFLQPTTGKWLLHPVSCPFQGFFPLPLKELDEKKVKHGIIADYCRAELTKQLTAFRKRIDKIMFYFHPCDALAFCYGDLPYKFDIIDTSNLADSLGLANLLNAAGRKLLSDQSLLSTETVFWYKLAPTVAQYVQEVLCCPLSFIPTIYGFRLMDNVEWGQEASRCTFTNPTSVMSARLRWKKAMVFDQAPLVLTPPLKICLQQIMDVCALNYSSPELKTTAWFFSPLTFFYILSDLIQRGSIQESSALMTSFVSRLDSNLQKSFETYRAWMENRPVWRVKVRIGYSSVVNDSMLFDAQLFLRLVLIPKNDIFDPSVSDQQLYDLLISSKNLHLIDNIEVKMKMKSSGLIEWVDIEFLLDDRSLLESHCGIVSQVNGVPAFLIHSLSDHQHVVELFTRHYPWPANDSTGAVIVSSRSNEPQLVGESCEEIEDAYNIRFKIFSNGRSKPHSGMQINFFLSHSQHSNITFYGYFCAGLKVAGNDEPQQRWPCRSSHRITVSLDGVNPLTITLPYPILHDTLKTTLRQKDGIVEVVAAKALNNLWPEDVIRDQFRWNADKLEPWTDIHSMLKHTASQFPIVFLKDIYCKVSTTLDVVRLLIKDIIVSVTRETTSNQPVFQLRVEGSPDRTEWFILVHHPVRISPGGAPVLLLTALDQRQVDRLESQGKWNRRRGDKDYKRIFGSRDLPDKFPIMDLKTAEQAQLLRHILYFNSTKIQLTSWQKQNLPHEKNSPYLATFLRPLYLDSIAGNRCFNCLKPSDHLKFCGRCRGVQYCSVECQHTHWPKHKLKCRRE